LHSLFILESAKPDSENLEAYSALQTIADFFAKCATSQNASQVLKKLFIEAMRSISEIDLCLEKFSKNNQEELLNLITKLRALITNPGAKNLYSDSIYQITQQKKYQNSSSIMKPAQKEYFDEFVKFKKLAFNENTAQKWEEFANLCALDSKSIPKMTKVLLLSQKLNVESSIVNIYFNEAHKNSKALDHHSILEQLYKELDTADQELQDDLQRYHSIIESFAKKINQWTSRDKFTALFQDFEERLIPLIDLLDIDDAKSVIAKNAILQEVHYLTDVYDRTLKSLKGSSEYKGCFYTLHENFMQLLKPYHQLMVTWVKKLPQAHFSYWSSYHKDNYKVFILQQIEARLIQLEREKNHKAFSPSQIFSVASARIASTASFSREFIEKFMTLEDLFSLIHQNIITCLNLLNINAQLILQYLPEPLRALLFRLLPQERDIKNLSTLTIQHPFIQAELNFPMENHGCRIELQYHIKQKTCDFTLQFFAPNWYKRVDAIQYIALLEGFLCDAKIIKKPTYNI
ncbi:MAG TPA: hypothetical protein VHM20_02145, partial [Gammaproteobacteria bacterium]|nr:hypothetical protein [Gammaproteobacteria bacterium]